MSDEAMEVFNIYNEALAKGDFAAVFNTMSDEIKWHQPGKNPMSGIIIGKETLGVHLGKFAEKSHGTFQVVTNWVTSNENFVAANVTFMANRGNGDVLNMNGIDLFRIEDGKIQEVWLFSSNQGLEDIYWK
ncbi:nuclear transport factor 2 family protein [Listeria booriae]|uniref:Nuclear transport factor 2 family protein n=1 Tax=Listeria booriae TaxID=1552123 RepID=A0A842AD74_9LIST|nr:nuclear transport factor 2 family protein [Listeria booriae]MBC1400481.1 nuclear transport factor 2 family protein [Listeria booriae]MBC1615793.1 nuclear transport factor 2 family protein [Listeria booriae]MBC2319303.1 nuclear transport factor 2 family protein [Listeria booriae]